MTPILAKVGAVHKQGDRYLVIIRIIRRRYRGSFNTFAFGKIKPLLGSYHNGRLDLVYYANPGLEIGHTFSLWRID